MGGINKNPICAGFDVEENNREIIFKTVERICGGVLSISRLLLIKQVSILISHISKGDIYRATLCRVLSFLKNNEYLSNHWTSLILPLERYLHDYFKRIFTGKLKLNKDSSADLKAVIYNPYLENVIARLDAWPGYFSDFKKAEVTIKQVLLKSWEASVRPHTDHFREPLNGRCKMSVRWVMSTNHKDIGTLYFLYRFTCGLVSNTLNNVALMKQAYMFTLFLLVAYMVTYTEDFLGWSVGVYLTVVYILIVWAVLECVLLICDFFIWAIKCIVLIPYRVLHTLCFGSRREQEDVVELLTNIFIGGGAVVTVLKIFACACGLHST